MHSITVQLPLIFIHPFTLGKAEYSSLVELLKHHHSSFSLVFPSSSLVSILILILMQMHVALMCPVYILGLGFGFMFLGSLVRCQSYFVAYRATANGLIASGAGIGSLIFDYVTSVSLQEFGWRDTLRIQVICILYIL